MSTEHSNTSESHQPDLTSLQSKLDSLWETHLVLLDQYYQAQSQLQKHLSSGFFSLAQASFKSPTRTRFGQDYYDERMQAVRYCHVQVDDDNQTNISVVVGRSQAEEGASAPQLLTPPSTPQHDTDEHESDFQDGAPSQARDNDTAKREDEKVSGKEDEASAITSEEENDTAKRTGEDSKKKDKNTREQEHDETNKRSKEESHKPMKTADPLHWYGILVPPQLRQAQNSFVAAVNGPLGDAANAAQALKRLDTDIRKLRKDIKKAEKKSAVLV